MKFSRAVFLIAIASFLVGILLSILFNSLFIFLFLPFGIGWGFARRSEPKQRRDREEQDEDVERNTSASN
jgi:hypothetical protein